MKATLKNFRQSPRKVLLVAKMLRGKPVLQAVDMLRLVDKKVSEPLCKLILSAVSNAKQSGKHDENAMTIKDVCVNQGVVFKRYRPRAFGRATPIRRRTSTICVELQA